MIAEQRLKFTALDPARPDLLDLLDRLKRNTPAFAHMEFQQPQKWYGVTDEDRLMAAYGWSTYLDGTIEVKYAVCEPCKDGLRYLAALAGLLALSWKGRRVVFFTEVANRRMRRIVESIGAKPVALMYEWQTTEGQ